MTHRSLKCASAVLAAAISTLAACAGESTNTPATPAGAGTAARTAAGGLRPHCSTPIGVSESFAPEPTLQAGAEGRLTVTLTQSCPGAWKFDLADTLPVGFYGGILLGSNCQGVTLASTPQSVSYGGTVTIFDTQGIPAAGTCSWTWEVQSHAVGGPWYFTIPANAVDGNSTAASTWVRVAGPAITPGPIHTI